MYPATVAEDGAGPERAFGREFGPESGRELGHAPESELGDEPGPEPGPVRVVVADDQQIVRDGFAALIDSQPDLSVVGTAGDGAQAVRVCQQTRPDVVLMDIRMPVMDGIEATRRLTVAGGPRSLILTTFDLDEYVYEALRAGASGFLLKDVTAERLFDAVRVVAAGDALLAPAVTRRLISEFAARRPTASSTAATTSADATAATTAITATADAPAAWAEPGSAGLSALTPRETQVLRQVAEGLSNLEIADRLVVTEQTVKTHVSRVLMKLGLRDRTQAVVLAYESGLVVPRAAR
jgi:DNA-binding NarL/FixJ family response regulator